MGFCVAHTHFLQHDFKFWCSFQNLFCMSSVVLGARADGSKVILARPHGTTHRSGDPGFREIFFRARRSVRTVIYNYLGGASWLALKRSCARLFIWFSIQSVSAVTSPRVALPREDESSIEPSSESEP